MIYLILKAQMNLKKNNYLKNLLEFRKLSFESHCKIILSGLLNPWAKTNLAKALPSGNDKENNKLIIFVEDRINSLTLLRFSILNSLLMCRLKMRVIVYTTEVQLSTFRSSLKDLDNWVDVLPIHDESIKTINIDNFNKLLKDSDFWKNIPSKSVLMMQIDAILIEPIEFSYFKYDYVGAPWCIRKSTSIMFYNYSNDLSREISNNWETLSFCVNNPIDIPFGNGGLSIRNTEKMASICDLEESDAEEPEDFYFSKFLLKYKSNLPTINEARRFACETDYYQSFGSHASHLYLKAEEQARIYERHFTHLISLIQSSINE
tara:strand:+ start:647 stop:1603 length:957 start_codon:yes stop_codon:yes gene_type:complete